MPARAPVQALRDQAGAAVVDVYRLWASRPSHGGDDLREVIDFASPLVPGHFRYDEHQMRGIGQTDGARTGRLLPDGLADDEQDSEQAHDRRGRSARGRC
jgi:hypothetical protein